MNIGDINTDENNESDNEMRHIEEGFDLDLKYNGSIGAMIKDKWKHLLNHSHKQVKAVQK